MAGYSEGDRRLSEGSLASSEDQATCVFVRSFSEIKKRAKAQTTKEIELNSYRQEEN